MSSVSVPVNVNVAVVTGAGSGIGASLVHALAKGGCNAIALVDIDLQNAKRVAEQLPESVKRLVLKANCGKPDEIENVVNQSWKALGPIDAFFSNAGIGTLGGVENTSDAAWDLIWRVNVMSHTWAAKALLPLWRQEPQKKRYFVITASAAGLLTQVESVSYSVTKHAAVSAAEWLAITHKSEGISVHCLCPQAVDTAMLKAGAKASGSRGTSAGIDGVLSADIVARDTLVAMTDGKFMILPHPRVANYFKKKATNYDRWIDGMEKLRQMWGASLNKRQNSKL